jgi:translation initiation factor 1A
MPNIKGGKNYKKGKKGKGKAAGKKAETPYADSAGLIYAQVKRKLGGDRLEVECNDGKVRQAIIPGSFYKRVWINANDILLIQINEMNISEGYILYKYIPSEAHHLKTKGDLKFDLSSLKDDDGIKFVGAGDDDSEDEDDEENIDNVHKEVEKELTKSDRKLKEKEAFKKMEEERSKKIIQTHIDDDNIDIDNI